ncbi:uncharacterized protein FOMMEDRAFT_125792 [Fomitiporia mediterranea MF3/22]|uniref:uncharacterized protein n=1 Tax=Fomitiporia mediterranea (strain MF3/22) TaxID=694068 RepID=UPI0004407E9A|nr:uncharacterized protein FOMMEDRAFT_125792 [Fomitiporia mediterranea MF3/22]EJD01130.1 hypothetical protein FOMMEDRAFT_125792 [Fomitiporia mediterranea MF3/22]
MTSNVFKNLAQLLTSATSALRSEKSGWTTFLIVVIQLLVIGQIFRAWIGPFILRNVTKRVQVRRVSLRSIRGVYVRLASMTIRIDRVGISLHSSAGATRRFAFKVEGLCVEIHELKVSQPPRKPLSRRLSRLPTLADFAPSPMARRLWSAYSAIYVFLEPYVRPFIRSFFVTSARIVIRCLPVLTQVVDFELDRALLTFTTLPEAHVAIRNVTLSATVAFSNLESVVGIAEESPHLRRRQRFLSMSHLRNRFAGSARRVLGRAWGSTQGTASFSLKLHKVSGFASPDKWFQLNPDAANTSWYPVASQFAFVTHSSHSDDLCFDLQDVAELSSSFAFGPTKRIIEDHSVSSSLRVSSIQVSTGPLHHFLRAIGNLRKASDKHVTSGRRSELRFKKSVVFRGNDLSTRRLRHIVYKFALFRSIDLSVKDISVHHIIQGKDGLRPRYFTGHIRSLAVSLELGEPERHFLHKDFLGNCPDRNSDLDAEVVSYSCVAKDMTVYRRSTGEHQPSSRVISISSISLQGFVTQWTRLNMPTTHIFPGDPNDALLVIRLGVVAPQFSERVDVVVDVLEHLRHSRATPTTSREPLRILHHVPRLKVEVAVDDVAACLTPAEHDGISLSSLILSSTQCVISMSTYFKHFPLAKSSLAELQEPNYVPLEMEITAQSVLGPAFVMVLPKPFSLDTSSNQTTDSRGSFRFSGDPLLSLSAFEFTTSGQTLGGMIDETDEVVLDVDSTMFDVKCITDAVSIELWQPSAIFSLKSMLESGRSLSNQSNTENGLLQKLPSGITAHFAVGQIGIILTGKDMNPDEDLDLSRGIAVKTRFALQYCSLHDRKYFTRIPKRFAHTHDRQRLYLSDDLLMEAISTSSVSKDARKFVLFGCILRDTIFRTCVATEFAADHAYEANDEPDELKTSEFIWCKRVEMNASCRYTEDGCNPAHEHIHVITRIPNIQSRFQLFHAYCTLLALSTVRSLAQSRQRSVRQKRTDISSSFKVTVTTLQVVVTMPLEEQACIRINGLNVGASEPGEVTSGFGTLFLWVPTLQEDGKWEELIRLHSWKLAYHRPPSGDMEFILEGKGGRLRIPHGYILAELILNINLFGKCVKHLLATVHSGEFRPMSAPSAEDAKVVPAITVKLGSLSLEAADDPLESKLGLIWRAGFEAARSRLERDEAFQEKVTTIRAAEAEQTNLLDSEGRFTPHHTVSIEEARERLLLVHSLSWVSLYREYCDEQQRNETSLRREIRGEHYRLFDFDVPPLVPLAPSPKTPPLIRFAATGVSVNFSQPAFPADDLSGYLQDLGNGVPRDTQFSLLVPLHLHISLGATCVTLRDYPLPLLNIVQESPTETVAWVVDMDLVVAEEMGTPTSVAWKDCPIVPANSGSTGAKSLALSVPKTTMPVKTYATPIVNVLTNQVTEFCWGNSYAPAIQDVMRIIDTLTTPPPDPSPSLGFWDKMRLVLHWRAEFKFASEVRLNLKGSRDPYATDGVGAGFAFCWLGNTRMTIGQPNPDKEVLQVHSDAMLIVIPIFMKRSPNEVIGEGISPHSARGPLSLNQGLEGRRKLFRKICANFSSGIKWGIGIVLERSCGNLCPDCHGMGTCRLFSFRPHHEVTLEPKSVIPTENTPDDSFNGFRSDFIHFSTSLSSSINNKVSPGKVDSSSFHLSPKMFAHFWSWWALFDRSLSIAIRQGALFPRARPPSKKFTRHLATIKYRLAIQRLFISHIYMDDSRESWSEGVTHCVGVKALVNSFEADMHQREQEATVTGIVLNTTKKIRHKPFYAAEVKLIDAQMRAILATFVDPSKRLVDDQDALGESKYRDVRSDESVSKLRGFWFDLDDFVETDWKPTEENPRCHMIPIASCPRFTYFKRASRPHHDSHQRTLESSRFGNEDTHVCLMGKEPSVQTSQAQIVQERLSVLQQHLSSLRSSASESKASSSLSDFDVRYPPFNQTCRPSLLFQAKCHALEKKIRQLERHIVQLQESDERTSPQHEQTGEYAKYLMPSDITIPLDWTEFDNVYQAHCPKFSLNNSTRDILIQYYYCSRVRRGIEYHMATRAVKYIRDQVDAYSRASVDSGNMRRPKNPTGLAAQVAAQAIRKILIGNENESPNIRSSEATDADDYDRFDPMDGWSTDSVSQNKSHFCLLLKPQVVLRSETAKESVVVLAALQATLQSHAILDTGNIDDPVSGRVMTRSHAVLSGIQTFCPTATCPSRHEGVPLEVLIDLRAESSDFDRMMPQTNATFRYDKFNRLRLRNNVTSVVPNSTDELNSHLQHQTDLIDVRVPRFTVSANSKNFASLQDIITNLLLHSDAAHKLRSSKVETLLFSYDFTDLLAAADVVEDLQSRLRRVTEHEQTLEAVLQDDDEQGHLELMKIKAHVFLLSEELNLIFDAINLAQEKADDKHSDTKMALKVHASARDISWGMVDEASEMIAKLAVRGIDFTWLSRQDGSTVNNLIIMDLQAFDGSPDAQWPEILSKYREPSNHSLVKRGVFVQADWIVLAPVGGITIYEQFILDLHPMRLQLEARIGKSIMEYVWPARRDRRRVRYSPQNSEDLATVSGPAIQQRKLQRSSTAVKGRASLDSPSTVSQQRSSIEERRLAPSLGTRRITSSRSFTDLRSTSRQNSMNSGDAGTRDHFLTIKPATEFPLGDADPRKTESTPMDLTPRRRNTDDAAEMKTRSAQKTFVLVRISSMHILLSFHKDGSFFCRDARIHTRELQYRNQTWSFEELAEQFIPSDTSWRGWMRMALHQPLVPVLPVARELFSKTKWIAAKGRAARQSRKDSKPTPPDTSRFGEQSSASAPRTQLPDSPKKGKLRRPRKSSEKTNNDIHELTSS